MTVLWSHTNLNRYSNGYGRCGSTPVWIVFAGRNLGRPFLSYFPQRIMKDSPPEVFLPHWISAKPKWILQLWSTDDCNTVDLFMISHGQHGRIYEDSLPFSYARSLIKDLQKARSKVRGEKPFWNHLFRSRRRVYEVFRDCREYKLLLWRRVHSDTFSSLTLHGGASKDVWILEMDNHELWQFVDDLTAAICVAEHWKSEGMELR